YSGALGNASAAVMGDFVVVDMFAEACTGNKSPKDAAHDAAERVNRYYNASLSQASSCLSGLRPSCLRAITDLAALAKKAKPVYERGQPFAELTSRRATSES